MGPLPGLHQIEGRPPDDDLLAERQETLEDLLEVEDPGLAPVDGQHDDPEGGLHLGMLVELVQDDRGDLVPLQVENDADPLAVRFVPEVGDPADLLLLDELRDLLDEVRLVDLIGKLGHDDALAVVPGVLLDQGARPHPDDPPPRPVSREDPLPAVDEPGRREVRPLDIADQPVDGDVGVPDERDGPVDHLPEVMGRDVGRHADGDASGAVEEQKRYLRRQDGRLLHRFVVVGHEIDGIFLQISEELLGDPGHPDLRVPHGGRRIPVDGAEVPLAVDERVAHRELLGHPDDGVVGRRIPVGVVFTDDIPDDPRRLLVGLVPAVPHLAHGEEDPAVDRLQAVPDVGDRPADDDAHRVVHVGLLHLVFDIDRDILFKQVVHLYRISPYILIRSLPSCHSAGTARGGVPHGNRRANPRASDARPDGVIRQDSRRKGRFCK